MLKISITSGPATARWGSQRAAQAIAAAGFDAVDYQGACSSYKHFAGLYTAPDAEFYAHFEAERRIYQDAGLAIAQMHCPYNPPPDRVTEQELEFFVASVKRAIRAAAVLGAPCAVVHPVIPTDWQTNQQKSYDITDRLCSEYAELGEKYGVTVALENMPGGDTTVPYSAPEQFLKLLDKLKSPRFGICLDTGHANWALPDGQLPAMVRALAGHIVCMHMHDNGGTWDNHFFPFGGSTPWNELCAALGQTGYTGAVNLETCHLKQTSDALFTAALGFQCAIAAELRDKIVAGCSGC